MKFYKSLLRALTVIVTFMFLSSPAHARDQEWVIAEGEAFQGEMDTLKEVRDRAKRDAETKAIEKAVGTFLKSHTLVSNSQIAEDLIYASVRGKIKKHEIIRSAWDAKDRNLYRVKIRALVEPVYPEKGEGLSAKISLSKTDLKEGDEVRLVYQVNRDAYVYIFSVAADGSVTLLVPNSNSPEHFAQGGQAYQFPEQGGPIHLKAMLLPGFAGKRAEERIKLIATKKKEDLLSLGFREGLFQAYDARSTGMISDLVRRLNQMDPTEWTDVTTTYTIKR